MNKKAILIVNIMSWLFIVQTRIWHLYNNAGVKRDGDKIGD